MVGVDTSDRDNAAYVKAFSVTGSRNAAGGSRATNRGY